MVEVDFLRLHGLLAFFEAFEERFPARDVRGDECSPSGETLELLRDIEVGVHKLAMVMPIFGPNGLKEHVNPMNLTETLRLVSKLGEQADSDEVDYDKLLQRLGSVVETLKTELQEGRFLWIPTDRFPYYSASAGVTLNERAQIAFPSIVSEFDQACRCYALDCYTACVFHSMRCLEVVCRAAALSIDPNMPKGKDGWGDYHRHAEKKITEADKGDFVPPAHWPESKGFFQEILTDLRAVYRAWRNPTMHLEKRYDDQQCLKIMKAAKDLIEDTAAHVDERGTFAP